MFDLGTYRQFFQQTTGHNAHDYQVKVAQRLMEGKNVVLRAPTGAGKTWSVMVPFFFPDWQGRPARLIYALPLRTLAQGIYREARAVAGRLGQPLEGQINERGQETVSPYVTLQTGEQPDDRFFDRGRIIVTTYDQLLSGMLDQPYGLSGRLHNINAAAVVGALVVFDEFHLMEPDRAFLTAAAGLHLFRALSQSVWMTATATVPLVELLCDATEAVPVPESDSEWQGLLNALPSVTQVSRSLVWETDQLSADAVLRSHRRRSIVLLNTVARSQEMFLALQQRVREQPSSSVSVMLLHSRFFKEHRRNKEERLHALFGRNSNESAILVATQVVEAGLDISCEELHTELCPMNALVQRAGRCARFEGESGTVRVYPLPMEDRAWLPYGDAGKPDMSMIRTREVVESFGNTTFNPSCAVRWVQEVHGDDDETVLREGWRPRLAECLRRIEQNAILRDPKGVAHLIRGENTDSIRVIISDIDRRPSSPAHREGLSLSRRSLYGLFKNDQDNLGWYWDGADEEPWKTLTGPPDIHRTYVICLRPTVAAYDHETGLRLGVPGIQESPDREEPPRPGWAPYRSEPWTDHARRVAKEGERRLKNEGRDTGLVFAGLQARYGLAPRAIEEAVRACGLLHDFGKLQESWQRWAAAAQRAQNDDYEHRIPLAHTDFNPENESDRQREQGLGLRRPPHAPASLYYGRAFLLRFLPTVSEVDQRAYVASACAAAVVAHHGGWWPSDFELNPPPLWEGWKSAIEEVAGFAVDAGQLRTLQNYKVEPLLQITVHIDSLYEWWPLVAYLMRTLRLSDQRATAERGCNE